MKLKSQSSVSFFSDEINQEKYDIILTKAKKINKFKNELSLKIANNILDYIELSKFDMLKKENTQIDGITGQEIQLAIVDVYTMYQNKFDSVNSKLKFRVFDRIENTYYQRNTKYKNKGDLKTSEVKFKSTDLSKALTYISKTKFTTKKEVVDYMKLRIEKTEELLKEKEDKKLISLLGLYNSILKVVRSKKGKQVVRVATKKRQQIFNRIKPIEFKSLTFRSLNRLSTQIVDYSKNKSSNKLVYFTLGGYGRKLDIPVTYSKKYHGNIKEYQVEKDGQKQIPYTVCFTKDRIKFTLTKEIEREYISGKENLLGVDVNIKHNIFACSDGTELDLNRNMLKGYSRLLKRIDQKKKGKTKEEKEIVTEYYKPRTDKWLLRYKGELQTISSNLVKHCISTNIDHIVMEDLQLMGRMFSKEEDTGLKYSRLAKLIHLNTLNVIVGSICEKKGLQLSLVNPAYTSQECSECGYVDKQNRKTQEEFICLECGYSENADIKSAKVIKKRVANDVHRKKLTKLDNRGWLVPTKLGHKKIKTYLLDSFDKQNVVIIPSNRLE